MHYNTNNCPPWTYCPYCIPPTLGPQAGSKSKSGKIKMLLKITSPTLKNAWRNIPFQVTTVPKFKNLGEKAIRFDLPWPVKILEDISRGDFAMVEWAPYLDVVIKDQYTKNKRCDFSVSVILLFFQSSV